MSDEMNNQNKTNPSMDGGRNRNATEVNSYDDGWTDNGGQRPEYDDGYWGNEGDGGNGNWDGGFGVPGQGLRGQFGPYHVRYGEQHLGPRPPPYGPHPMGRYGIQGGEFGRRVGNQGGGQPTHQGGRGKRWGDESSDDNAPTSNRGHPNNGNRDYGGGYP